MCFKLHREVEFSERITGDQTHYVAKHKALGKFFQLGPEEYRAALLLDGTRTMGDVATALADQGIHWSDRDIAEFVRNLLMHRVAIAADPVPVANHSDRSERSANDGHGNALTRNRIVKALSWIVSQRLPLVDGDVVAARLVGPASKLFAPTGMIYVIGFMCIGLAIVAFHSQQFAAEIHRFFDPGMWLVLLVIWVIAKVIHELGHAVAAKYHGVRVGKIGVLFFLLAPIAYVDVTDAWKLRNRWSRIQIALAGVYVELAMASVAALLWWLLPDGLARHLAAQFFLVAGPGTLLVNANPLLRLDGYYVLSDLTGIPNLRMHGRSQLAAIVNQKLFRIPAPRPLLSGWRRRFATVHAACSLVFQTIWMTGLIIGVSMWSRGAGVVMAGAAITVWLLMPLTRWVIRVWNLEPAGRWYLNPYRKRLLSLGLIAVAFMQYLTSETSPFARHVPVVVQFREPQIARASSDAFVRQVFVTTGQRVGKGMLLVELEDPELQLRRDAVADDLEIAQLRTVQFRRQGALAKSAAEAAHAESLRRQWMELNQQVDGLRIVASRDGLVVGANLDRLPGRFVHRGDELLSVSDPTEKELLIVVDESDVGAYRHAMTIDRAMPVRLRGGMQLEAYPSPLRPRARRDVPHPALAATAGGPLPIELGDGTDQAVRVIAPVMEGRVRLDAVTSTLVQSGQIGVMTVADHRSFFTRLIQSYRR